MTIQRRFVPATVEQVGDDQARIRMTTAQRARDGHILLPEGCILDNYRQNPIQLWQHDPNEPVGTNSEIAVQGDCIEALHTFAPVGVSAVADKVRGLVKSGVVRAVSIGFEILEAEPIDPARPRAGVRATKWELLECSFVSVPADTGAVVTARAVADAEWKVGAARDLPIEDGDSWDGPAAEASIFEHAGGDDFDPAKAKRGFLVYNAAEPKLRGSYKLPIAHVVDGELKVPKGAIRAAASRLPDADIPQDVKDSAEAVIKHYEEKAGMGDKERALAGMRTRMLVAEPQMKLRDLYDVAQLAYLLMQAGYIQQSADWEADIEGDNSPVPTMLGEACKQLGAALVAMTAEEVSELMASVGADDGAPGERRLRAWRSGMAAAQQRSGRVLSAKSRAALSDAHDKIEAGRTALRSFLDTTDGEAVTLPDDAEDTAERGADFRRRQADLLALSAA